MIDNTILDEMNLPLANSNEDLSIISENYFKPLFDVQKFIIRSAQERDKGIDFQIEIKYKNQFTNFHFAVQLKATDTLKLNRDSSLSLQLQTSNINYLLNNPMPAFYVLYLKNTNTFYVESINDFAKSLYEKDSNWNAQGSHVLRFSRILDILSIEEIYNLTLKKGKFQRTINENTIAYSSAINKGDKILIDSKLNITDDRKIREIIEGIGLKLINESNWAEVISLHKKASTAVARSSMYNLVLGIANYYSGNITESLSFLKAATVLKAELTDDLINHLTFFDATVKYSIGIINHEEYSLKTSKLENADNISHYIKLEKGKREYIENFSSNPDQSFEKFEALINEILNDQAANDSIKLNARCELILCEGSKNNMQYVQSISLINAHEILFGMDIQNRFYYLREFESKYDNWFTNTSNLKKEAFKDKEYFIYYNAVVNEIKVSYEFEVYRKSVSILKEIDHNTESEILDRLNILQKQVSEAINYYQEIKHIENLIVALSIKYEIQHFQNRIKESEITLSEISEIIDLYDLYPQRRKIEKLKNCGTKHELFIAFLKGISEESSNNRKEYEHLVHQMREMDEGEIDGLDKPNLNYYYIELFPIGLFKFPKGKIEKIYEILNINEEGREFFEIMFESMIPVANLFHDPITSEGYLDGNKQDVGIEKWRRIFRVRKEFYENNFFRFHEDG